MAAVKACLSKDMTIRPSSGLAKISVAGLKDCCKTDGANVRVVHEPTPNNPAHSAIRRLPSDNLTLLTKISDLVGSAIYEAKSV